MSENGWAEYQKLVLTELKRLSQEISDLKEFVSRTPSKSDYERLESEIEKIESATQKQAEEIAVLKVKASIWGAGAGFFAALLPVSLILIKMLLGV